MRQIISKSRQVIANFTKDPFQYNAKPHSDRPLVIAGAKKSLLYYNVGERNKTEKSFVHSLDLPIRRKACSSYYTSQTYLAIGLAQ